MINAVLIDDIPAEAERFQAKAKLPDDVRLHVIHSIEEAEAYLTDTDNDLDLVFCDVRLKGDHESDPEGFYLIQRVEERLGKLPFGIVFVTAYSSIYAVNLLVEQISPATLCGFAVKWELTQPRQMSFEEQIALAITHFRKKFTPRIVGVSTDGAEEIEPVSRWYFNDYLRHYLNERMAFDVLESGDAVRTLRVRISDIVAIYREDEHLVHLYFLQGEQLQRVRIDYKFDQLAHALHSISFGKGDDPQPALRREPHSVQRVRGPVFAKVAAKWVVNLHYPHWRWANKFDGDEVQGYSVWLINHLPAAGLAALAIKTHRECEWGRDWMRSLFLRLPHHRG